MKKIIINIFIFVFIWFAGFTLIQSLKYRAMNTDMVACVTQMDTGFHFVAGNVFGQSVVYKTDAVGKIFNAYEEKFGGTKEKLYAGEIIDLCRTDDIYYIASAKNKSGMVYYKLVQLTERFSQVVTVLSTEFDVSMKASKLNVVDNMVYLTMLTANREEALVYALNMNEENHNWYLLSRQAVSKNRYFIEAVYTGTVLQAGLDNGSYVYYEAETEFVLPDDVNMFKSRQIELENHNINLSSIQILLKVADQIVWQNLIAAIVCAALITGLYLMFSSRYYALRQYAVIGTAIFAMIVCSIALCMFLDNRNIQTSYLKNTRICFDFFQKQYSSDNAYFLDAKDYYNSSDYSKAYDELAEFAGVTNFVKELMLVHVDGDNEQVMVALNTYRNQAQTSYITTKVEQLIQQARESGVIEYDVQDMLGQRYGVYVVPLRDHALIKKYIVSIIKMDDAHQQGDYGRLILLLIGLVVMTISMAVAGVVIRYMTKDIRKFGQAMLETTEEAMLARKPEVNNNEIDFLWNSLAEVTKRYERVNYAKYLVLQAYYRFAPRQIENILGKESIIDVNIGDMVHIGGTMAMVAMRDKRDFSAHNYMNGINRDFEMLEKFQMEEEGIIINLNNSLTYLKMLFLEEGERALRFGMNMLQAFTQLPEEQQEVKTNMCILLHHSEFLYGVSGNREQTFPFTVCAESEALDSYVGKLQRMDAGLIITETVCVDEKLKKGCRYIGYVKLPESQKTIKLYQVLDAYPVSKRNRFLACEEQFQNAMQMFYHNEFYMARNAFSEVLKNNVEDEIARWYLFTCEKFSYEVTTEQFEYALLAE